MNRKTGLALIFVTLLCLLTSGCFNIEQEIFLEPDGSGDLALYFSMPDMPEALKKNAPPAQQDPQKLIDEMKRKFSTALPPAITLKDAKEIRRNGAAAYYIVLHFNRLDDVSALFDRFSKESLKEKDLAQPPDIADKSIWKIQFEKAGDSTTITQSFYADIMGAMGGALGGATGADKPSGAEAPSAPASPAGIETRISAAPKSAPKPAAKRAARKPARNAKPAAPKEEKPKEENPFEGLAGGDMKGLMDEETINALISSILKLRFVMHAPKKIVETNADIVLNGNIAVWNASFGAFIKEKKPIEMKMKY